MTTTEAVNKPVKVFQHKNVKVAVWRNETVQNGQTVVFYTATSECIYRDKKTGEWKSSHSYGDREIPLLQLGMADALQFITRREPKTAGTDDVPFDPEDHVDR